MPEPLSGLIQKAEMAIGAMARVADEEVLTPLAEEVALIRDRIDSPEDVLVVGVAGGTGSGKSSLVNALAAEEVAETGAIRPTTGRPLAVASPLRLGGVSAYLAAIGVEHTITAGVPDWLCLIDLPDIDSLVPDHRLRTERILPRLDAVVWVVDPEKYRDAALHRRFIRPLEAYGDRFVFAFNQIDRIHRSARVDIVSDLEAALADHGMDAPLVVETSAAPAAGPPRGTDALLDALAGIMARDALGSTLIGLGRIAETLISMAGGGGTDFERRARDVVSESADLLQSGDVEAVVDRLSAFLGLIAVETGGATAERIAALSAETPSMVQAISEAGASAGRRDDLARALDGRLMEPVRDILRARAETIATATDLSVTVASARRARQV